MRLTRSISRASRLLVPVLGMALLVSAYTAWGKVLLDALDAVRRDQGATLEQIYAANAPATSTTSPPAPAPASTYRPAETPRRFANGTMT